MIRLFRFILTGDWHCSISLFKVFVDAAKETPRLYFAPLREALHAVSKMQDAMMKTQRGQTRGEFGNFETRRASRWR